VNKSLCSNRLRAGLLALCISIGWTNTAECFDASKHRLQIVAADEGESTKRIVAEFKRRFPKAQLALASRVHDSGPKHAVHIALGPAALRSLLKQGVDGVIVSVFTSSQAYREILEEVPESRRSRVTAVFAEPSPVDQLRLVSAIFKKRVTVAVLLSDKNAYQLPILRRAAAQTNIELAVEPLSDERGLNRALNRVSTASALLAIPDSTIYNAENIRNILITTYRRDQLVFGFSTAFVKAGAAATTYSSVEDIAAQVEELLDDFTASGRVPDAQFPKYFGVAINDSVARSLNFVIDDSVRQLSRRPGEQKP
jgi:ABC-type uncharacterized transport system substrate-binding protein